jgi:hypothetical protein
MGIPKCTQKCLELSDIIILVLGNKADGIEVEFDSF